jgi:hypothetical protein
MTNRLSDKGEESLIGNGSGLNRRMTSWCGSWRCQCTMHYCLQQNELTRRAGEWILDQRTRELLLMGLMFDDLIVHMILTIGKASWRMTHRAGSIIGIVGRRSSINRGGRTAKHTFVRSNSWSGRPLMSPWVALNQQSRPLVDSWARWAWVRQRAMASRSWGRWTWAGWMGWMWYENLRSLWSAPCSCHTRVIWFISTKT